MACFRPSRQLNNFATFSGGPGSTRASRVLLRQSGPNPQPIRSTPTVTWNATTGPRNPVSSGGAIFTDPTPGGES